MRVEGQERAADPGKSVLLTASAGSGKTHALVGRIINLLLAGAGPGELAAITFTEKAAAEMKARLLKTLAAYAWGEAAAEEAGGLARTPEEVLSELSARQEPLKISTVHAFCHWLLKRFPLEAGVPAGFSVMDDSEIPLRRDAAAGECLEAAVGTALDKDLQTLSGAGFSVQQTKDLLAAALDRRGQFFLLEERAGGPEELDARLEPYSEECLARFGQALADAGLPAQASSLAGMLRQYGVDDDADRLDRFGRPSMPVGFKKAFARAFSLFYTGKGKEIKPKANPPLTKKAIKDALSGTLKGKVRDEKVAAVSAEYAEMHHAFLESLSALAGLYDEYVSASAAASFIRLYRKAEEVYTARNHGDGLLDFDDLEIYAYRLLSGPDAPVVMSRLDERTLHYLVDEFQDTGELQWAIMERLGSEAFAGQGAEGSRAATFFAVGDKKQSIYRFRKANYRLMDRLREKMESCIEPGRRDFPALDFNFRSAPEVLRVADDVFGPLIGGYVPSEPYRKQPGGSVKLRIAPDEAEALAEEVAAAYGLPVWDGNAFRPAGFADMAVLIRSRTALPEYEAALRVRGIGYKVAGGVGFFYQAEVQAVLNILKYLDNPADTVSLAAFLKSPLFGLSDGQVERVVAGGAELLEEICPRAHRTLDAASAGKSGPLGPLVETIIRESGAVPAFGEHGGPAAVLNLEKLTATARDFDARGGAGLQDFMEWVSAYREKADMATADLDLPRFRDFVTIMTVHSAKGLEFPVVFLPGAGRGRKNGTGPLLMGEGGRFALKAQTLLGRSTSYGALEQAEEAEQDGEETRLLYVAMTRAKDHLVVLAEDKKPAKGSWLEKIYSAAPEGLFGADFAAIPSPCEYVYPRDGRPAAMAAETDADEMPFSLPKTDRLAPVPPVPAVAWRSPSGMAGHLPEEAKGRFDPMLRGSIIHRCLEAHGKTGSYSVRAAAITEEGFSLLSPDEQKSLVKDIEAALAALLADSEMKALLSPGEGRHFELPLLLSRGDEIIYGHADLVIIEGRKARVIDYKSGFTETPPEAVAEAYRPQLEAYREAVKEAFGATSVEAGLLLVDRQAFTVLDFFARQE